MANHESTLERSRLRRFWPYLAAGGGYLGLTAIAVHPLLAQLSSAIVGVAGENADFAQFYWNIWWFQHAIFQLGRDPYYTNYILFPYTLNLAYHTFTPLLNILALPIYATLGLAASLNSWIVWGLVFNGLAMFAFLRHHRIAPGLAFLGGALFAFTSATTSRVAFVHLSMVPNGWLPLSLLAWDWLIERRRWPWAVLLGGVLYGTLLTDIQFIVWLALLLPPYALYTIFRSELQTRWRSVLLGLLAVIVFVSLALIAPLPQLVAGMANQYGQEHQGIIEDWYSTHLEDLVAWPPRYLVSERATLGVILPITLALGVFAGRKVRGRWFWLIMGGFFLVMAFGPTYKPLDLPLPFRLFYAIAGGTYRVAARFLLPAVFAGVVFSALSLQPVYGRLGRPRSLALIGGVLLLLAIENRWYEPLPTFTMPDYSIYHQISNEPGEFLILEVPVGPHNLFRGVFGKGGVLQYYAPVHHKQLINGAVSRAPVGLTDSYRQWPFIAALAEEAAPPELAAARAEFVKLAKDWNIHYVLIHRDLTSSTGATWAASFFNTQPEWCLIAEEGPILAYAPQATGQCLPPDRFDLPADHVISLDNGSERYLGLGWSYVEDIGGQPARWTNTDPVAELQVNLPKQAHRVTVKATSFVPDQIVSVYANDQKIAELSVGGGWNDVTFDLPATAITSGGVTRLTLAPSRSASPFETTNGQSGDKRQLAVAYASIKFEP